MTLYQELAGRFSTENIFFDQGTLQPGAGFLEEIKSHPGGTVGAFLALIGSTWTPAMIAHQRQSDDDYVVQEIELALRNGWIVIPLLVDDASLPDPLQLPPAIRALPDYQATRLRQASLDEDIGNLSARLNELRARMNDAAATPDVTRTEEPSDAVHVEVPTPAEPRADDEHYQSLVDEIDNLVIFLGAEVNADDREGSFQVGAAMLPDDKDLALHLAAKADLESWQSDLAEVAQYALMIRGEPNVFRWVRQIVGSDAEPGPVHKYLARLPRRLEELGFEKRYPMIVTPKLDVALERALQEQGEPFDVAIYMAPGTEYAGRFVHLSWGSADPRPVLTPNEYLGFPFIDSGELTRPVIVRINGAVDDLAAGYHWRNNFVITEDHYIDYLSGSPVEEVVPVQILAKLLQASCLFLGYEIADWRLRIFLHWIWRGEWPGGAMRWAVERDPDVLERRFWQRFGVSLYRNRLTDYVQGLDKFLVEHRDELR